MDEAIQTEMSLIAEDDFSIKIRIIFKFLLSPIHEYTTLLAVKRLQFLHQFDFVDQDHFAKFATTTSQRDALCLRTTCERHFLQLKPQRQQYSRHYGHFFVSLARQHFVQCGNISTIRSIVDLLGRLLRPQIERSALNVEDTDSEFR